MANTNDLKPIATIKPFTKFCCTIGAIPSSYLVSLTYEEQLLWLCDYLQNTLIPAINQNGEAVTELQRLYEQLKKYVDDYFENLDVQEEINNKLDEMAEHGELQAIIEAYLQLNSLISFDNITDLKNATNLINGSFAKTFGYTNINDGGGAYYKIVNSITETPDDLNVIELQNDLYAILIKEKYDIVFDSLQDLLDCQYLVAGTKCKTLGFYEKNDGGEAYYIIREITNQDETNNYSLIALNNSNTLVAELFTNNNEEIRITQLGIENNNKTILEYALENFKKVIIDHDITLTSGVTIDNNCNVELLEGLGGIINCEENGIVLTKNLMQLRDLQIEGSYDLNSIGLNLNSSYNYFENVMIAHFGIGINETEVGSWNNNFIRCNINQNTKFGVLISSNNDKQHNDIHFDKCRFVGNGENVLDNTDAEITKGDAIRILGGINITITDCDIETNSNAGIYLSDNDYLLRSINVENCYIENNKLTSIYYYRGSGAHKHINLSNNYFNPTNRSISNKMAEQEVAYVLGRADYIDLFSLPAKDINIKYKESILREMCKCGTDNAFPISNFKYLKNIENIGYTINDDGSIVIPGFEFWGYNIPILKGITYKMNIYGEANNYQSNDTVTIQIILGDTTIFDHIYTLTQSTFRFEASSINSPQNLDGIARLKIITSANKNITIKSLLIKPIF